MQFLILIRGRDQSAESLRRELVSQGFQILQEYGPSILIAEGKNPAVEQFAGHPTILGIFPGRVLDDAVAGMELSETERLGIAAWNERHSQSFREAKEQRRGEGLPWDHPNFEKKD
jgi:hypothetical protein